MINSFTKPKRFTVMRKKLFTVMIIAGALTLGACAEDETMDNLINDVELNQTTDPGDDDDDQLPPPPPPSGG